MVFKEHKWRVKHITANAQGAVTPGIWQQEYIVMGDLNSQTANAPTYADIFGGDETTYTFDRDKYNINNLRLQSRVTKYKKTAVSGLAEGR